MAFKDRKVDFYNKRLSQMKLERESFLSHYKDLQEYITPRKGRFFISDRNRGEKRNKYIINSVGSQALRVAVAGMLNGTMSPSRPWFSLETINQDLMDSQAVRDWLFKVETVLRTILNESNFYNMAPSMIKEVITFGTGCMSHEDDFQNVARFYSHTVGSYMLAQNDRLEVDTIAREFEWPVYQIVRKFGLDNVSTAVKDQYDKGNYESAYPITHFIMPNEDEDPNSPLATRRPYISVYYEPGNSAKEKDKYLNVSGFNEFPVYCPRWDVTEGDIYGTDCPGMTSLGDIRQLQQEERRKAQGIDKMVNPPLSGPPSVRNIPVSGLPGGLTVYEGDDQKQKLSAIYQIQLPLQEMRIDIDAVERRIEKAFFVDLFLAISNMEGIQPRNEFDLIQRNEERLIQLGPVLERLHGEFLTKLIDRLFNQTVQADILPPPPEELEGSPLKVKFISTLAMAQRAVATADIDRITQFTAGLAGAGWTGALDKFNADKAVDEYSRAIGVPPQVINSDEAVSEIRQQRAQQEQMQAQLEMAQSGANTAKMLSDAKTDDQNALTDLVGDNE